MTLMTALEIALDPSDLAISITSANDKFGVVITRGKGHNFKLLLDSPPDCIPSRDEALGLIENTLKACVEAAKNEFTDSTGPVTQILNPEELPYDEGTGLSKNDIIVIVQALRSGSASVLTEEVLESA